MNDEEILAKLHPKVPWSQLSLQIKELMQQARADERVKTEMALFEKNKAAFNFAKRLIEKEAYAKGQIEGIGIGTEQTSKHIRDSHLFKDATTNAYKKGQADLYAKILARIECCIAGSIPFIKEDLEYEYEKASESLGSDSAPCLQQQASSGNPKPEQPCSVCWKNEKRMWKAHGRTYCKHHYAQYFRELKRIKETKPENAILKKEPENLNKEIHIKIKRRRNGYGGRL